MDIEKGIIVEMGHKSGCLICGNNLVYSEYAEESQCFYCGEACKSNAKCVSGHFVCDRCHSLSANDLIEQYCVKSKSTDPLDMAITLMKNPSVRMHGPEHHFLVPAVLLASYYNRKNDYFEKEPAIAEARSRSDRILGGFCGSHGICGAGVGTGIFISLITHATPLSKDEWRLSNLVSSKSLLTIANYGGPRCCKRDSFLAIIDAVLFVKEHFGMSIDIDSNVRCTFSSLNKECLRDKCPFYDK